MKHEQLENAKNLFFIALFIDIAITTIVGFNSFSTINTLEEIQSGIQGTDSALLKSIELWANISKLTLLTMIGVGIALVKWLNTCYRYAKESIGASGFQNEKWTTAGWVIPFISLFKPYQIINEIYKAGAVGYSANDDWKKQNGSGLLLTWWIFYAITHFILWISSRQILRRFNMEDELTFPQIIGLYDAHVWVCGTSVVIALLWFFVANHLTQRLMEREPLSLPTNGRDSLLARDTLFESKSNATPKSRLADDEYHPVTPASISVPSASAKEIPRKSEVCPAFGTIPDLVAMPDSDDWAYEQVSAELERKTVDKTQWTKAFAETSGDANKTKALYIQRRVQRIVATEEGRIRDVNAQRQQALEIQRQYQEQEQKEKDARRLQEIAVAELELERNRQERLSAEQREWNEYKDRRRIEAEREKFGAVKIVLIVIAALGLGGILYVTSPLNEHKTSGLQNAPTDDSYAQGLVAYKRGDFASALKEWQPLATTGNPAAQRNLGVLYARGEGVTKDLTVAFDWYSKAAVQGDAAAQNSLGRIYLDGDGASQDLAKAFGWFQKSAAQGNAYAQTNLCMMYQTGLGVPKSSAKALEWCQKSAEQGDASSQTTLGWAYMSNDFGLTADYRSAMEWNLKAAKQGFGRGSENVGLLYENGWGVTIDYLEAANWYKKAIDHGADSGQAQFQLGGLYENGLGVQKNLIEALKLYREVVEKYGDSEDASYARSRISAAQ